MEHRRSRRDVSSQSTPLKVVKPLSSKKESPSQGSQNSQKQRFRQAARKTHENDWLAPRGSEREKQLLKAWARHPSLSQKDRDELLKWMNDPDEFARRNQLLWASGKKFVLGPVLYERAIERHRNLDDKEWLVACFTAQGIPQKEIAGLIQLGERMVDNIVLNLKQKIIQELACDVESIDRGQIACWFFGH